MKNKTYLNFAGGLFLLLILGVYASYGADNKKETLLENLQTAHYTETHESMLYAAFAERADAEQYGQIASLFRALSRAEKIHAANKAALIRELGAEPRLSSEPLHVGTTIENLDWANAAENYEVTKMYSDFVSTAEQLKDKDSARQYKYCLAAEPKHQAIFQQARNDLESYKGGNTDFYVCSKCGNTVRSLSFERCPVCDATKSQFEKVH